MDGPVEDLKPPVLKMKHPKITDPATGAKVENRTRIIYNEWITIEDIPERADCY